MPPFWRRSALVLPILILAAPAKATDSETQLWVTGTATVPFDKDTSALLMASQRFRDPALGGDIWLARGELDQKVSKALVLGGGVTYLGYAAGHEWRAHEQAVFNLDRWQLRSQLEERFIPGAPRPVLRLRQQARYSLPLDKADKIQLAGEFLYIARTERASATQRVDSYRLSAMVQHQFAHGLTLTGGYMLIYAPRIRHEDHVIHAPQVTLGYRF